jgi:hypothetical protein
MENKDHECTIGIWYDYDYSRLVTFEKLKECNKAFYCVYSMEQQLDWRFNTNLTRFVYCPYCGKKIDWEGMKNSLK